MYHRRYFRAYGDSGWSTQFSVCQSVVEIDHTGRGRRADVFCNHISNRCGGQDHKGVGDHDRQKQGFRGHVYI